MLQAVTYKGTRGPSSLRVSIVQGGRVLKSRPVLDSVIRVSDLLPSWLDRLSPDTFPTVHRSIPLGWMHVTPTCNPQNHSGGRDQSQLRPIVLETLSQKYPIR
jgi:hypothetical protein